MRLLLIEDKADFAKSVESAVRAIPDVELVWVGSRDNALARLQAEHFDLVLLDRSIPTADGVLDDHPEHGWRVFQHVRETLPGVPVWFLTGAEDHEFAANLNNDFGRTADLHGKAQAEPMYLVCWKKGIADCVRRIKVFAGERTALGRIVVRSKEGLNLRPEEDAVLRIFARQHGGAAVDIISLNGGLSRSRVLKVVVRNAADGILTTSAAKVSPLKDIADERVRYNAEISRLLPGGYPSLTVTVDAGAGDFGGLFYGMVGDSVESLFKRLAAGHASLPHVPARIRAIEGPWYLAKEVREVPVAQIRRRMIGDVSLNEVTEHLQDINIAGIEARVVRAGHCSQHGDMHCANVVFAGAGDGMVIDFGDAGPSVGTLDPITLELSTVFHAQHTTLPAGWPTEQHMANWVTPGEFVKDCAFGPFILGCRAWANDAAASPEEVIAMAYAYAMRQLKYSDTRKPLLRALIKACINALLPAG
jgi:CheY-like chemotaxis protein